MLKLSWFQIFTYKITYERLGVKKCFMTTWLMLKKLLKATSWFVVFFIKKIVLDISVTRQNMFDLKNKLNFNSILPSNTDSIPTQKQNQHFELNQV